MQYVIAGVIGLVGGVASGLFGVGGGIVMVPAMFFLMSPPIRDIKQAIGTSLVVIIPTALIGAFKHYKSDPALSNIHWPTAASLVPTAIAGSYLGAWLVTRLQVDDLKRAFGGFLVAVGCYLLFGPQK
ncbi:MAG: sulfite exporter TauE/SafE family protein [Pedosphaera sp.]|nr:sulfite exporter TauE/SafE family protein [Pedosphaera sp.]MST00704.1 sulfite exporter TauE/SafE family protein [Pedosphaera sp.]